MQPHYRNLSAALSLALVGVTVPHWASADSGGAVQVSDAWVRETIPGQSVGAAYMRIRSKERLDLIGVKTKVSKSAGIHQMSMQGGVMKMRELSTVRVDPGIEVSLEPGATHIMLVDVRRPLTAGDKVGLTLIFRRADRRTLAVTVSARVRSTAGGVTDEH